MFIEVLPDHLPGHLETLSKSGILAAFYMAGGTGSALQLGHRRSKVHTQHRGVSRDPALEPLLLVETGSFNLVQGCSCDSPECHLKGHGLTPSGRVWHTRLAVQRRAQRPAEPIR